MFVGNVVVDFVPTKVLKLCEELPYPHSNEFHGFLFGESYALKEVLEFTSNDDKLFN